MIEVNNLSYEIEGKQILKDINLKVYRGETLIILGKSGSGKSVTLKCIEGLLMPSEGKVNVLNEDVPDLTNNELQDLRKKIGFILEVVYSDSNIGLIKDFTNLVANCIVNPLHIQFGGQGG